MVVFDLAVLKASAERTDAGPVAVVERAWLGAVLKALTDPTQVLLLKSGSGPTPMVIA